MYFYCNTFTIFTTLVLVTFSTFMYSELAIKTFKKLKKH